MKTGTLPPPASAGGALRDALGALRCVVDFELPRPLIARMRSLLRRKEGLSHAEKMELAALVDLADDKATEKLQAQVVIEALKAAFPTVSAGSSDTPA